MKKAFCKMCVTISRPQPFKEQENRNEKIDFVLTWVDGSDPDWLAQRREYQPGRGTDAGESRYRDWDNLQYWFRGVENFAMNTPQKASIPVIKRLPKYYRYLRSLQADGITSISSRELASQMGTTASQVRQDFNCIGDVNGRQGIGYSVENLLSILESLLFGNGDRLPTILIGCGRLGKAVSRFITTDTNGYKLIAAFDVAENEVGKEISGIRIRHIDELEAFCEENKPKVAVLCVPRDGAQQVSGRLVDLGIEGFWNFSHYDLSVSYPNVVVENVHLGDSLMSLGYRLRNQE